MKIDTPSGPKPAIRLWIFNHKYKHVADIIDFFVASVEQEGYSVTVGKCPCPSSLNVVIEGFDDESLGTVSDFSGKMRKKVAIIMTEHIDFIDGQLFAYGVPIGVENNYVSTSDVERRVDTLVRCRQHAKCLLGVADGTALIGIDQLFPGIPLHRIPFPALAPAPVRPALHPWGPGCDFVFTGNRTEHRTIVINRLKSNGLQIHQPRRLLSPRRRDGLYRNSKIIVNIPPSEAWQWLSPMRVISALQAGRATVSLGTSDNSEITKCTLQLQNDPKIWPDILKKCRENWRESYNNAFKAYAKMVASYRNRAPFPHGFFERWAIKEGVKPVDTIEDRWGKVKERIIRSYMRF